MALVTFADGSFYEGGWRSGEPSLNDFGAHDAVHIALHFSPRLNLPDVPMDFQTVEV